MRVFLVLLALCSLVSLPSSASAHGPYYAGGYGYSGYSPRWDYGFHSSIYNSPYWSHSRCYQPYYYGLDPRGYGRVPMNVGY